MKKSIIVMMLLLMIRQSYAQQQPSAITDTVQGKVITEQEEKQLRNDYRSQKKDYSYYMSKSRTQNTAGWVLAGTGAGIFGIAFLFGNDDKNSSSWGPSDGEVTRFILATVGGLLVVGSIPCFVVSGVNKHKAKMMLSSQKTSFGIPVNAGKTVTGISLAIPIGK